MSFNGLPIRDESPRLAGAMGYLATRSEQDIRESIARVNEARARLGLGPISAEAEARMLAQGRR